MPMVQGFGRRQVVKKYGKGNLPGEQEMCGEFQDCSISLGEQSYVEAVDKEADVQHMNVNKVCSNV